MARIRTFLAVDVGESIRRQAQAVQAELAASAAEVKWVDGRNLHITLLFLGDVEDRDLPEICRLTARAAARIDAFRISIAGLGAFPSLRRPKTIWAAVNEGRDDLVRLAAELETVLGDSGHYRSEDRAYVPHLTLGRAKSEAAGQAIAPLLEKRRGWTAGIATIEEVLVMASELRRGGPEHSVIGRAELGG